jgi:hypothetical protein
MVARKEIQAKPKVPAVQNRASIRNVPHNGACVTRQLSTVKILRFTHSSASLHAALCGTHPHPSTTLGRIERADCAVAKRSSPRYTHPAALAGSCFFNCHAWLHSPSFLLRFAPESARQRYNKDGPGWRNWQTRTA